MKSQSLIKSLEKQHEFVPLALLGWILDNNILNYICPAKHTRSYIALFRLHLLQNLKCILLKKKRECWTSAWRNYSPPSFDVLVINILMGPGCATGVCRSQGGEYWKELALEYCNLPKIETFFLCHLCSCQTYIKNPNVATSPKFEYSYHHCSCYTFKSTGDIIALTFQFFMRGRRGKGGVGLVVEGEDLSLFFPPLSQTLSPEDLRWHNINYLVFPKIVDYFLLNHNSEMLLIFSLSNFLVQCIAPTSEWI